MKIILVNNFKKIKGGAEISLWQTKKLLKKRGHKVLTFGSEDVAEEIKLNPFELLYSFPAKRKLDEILTKFQPDIVHLNNIYHHLSPSIIDVFKKKKIPVVLTLRDYKLICAIYKLWRQGKVCEECSRQNFKSILKNNCHLKGYLGESLLLWAEMMLHHKILKIYDKIDIFTAPSRFLIKKFKQMGFKRKIFYLPNFVPHDVILIRQLAEKDLASEVSDKKNSIIYFGRLTPEKGVETLIEAVKDLPVKLKIIGDGPIKKDLRFKIYELGLKNVELLGWMTGNKLRNEIRRSLFTVLPSLWYENNPRSILESFALGKPVIASNIGGIPELVKDSYNGLLFRPGDNNDLREKIIWLISHSQSRLRMGKRGYELVKEKYNEEIHYQNLMKIYKSLLR